MVDFPSFNTPEADALCKDIAKKSNGVCFFGFSRGKDSLCSWLQLRRYFKRIIPFHCSAIPYANYMEQALCYYEEMFNTHILRIVDGGFYQNLYGLMYQTLESGMDFVTKYRYPKYNKLDLLDALRITYNLPRAWCAFGINASDSIDRRIYVNQYQGRMENNKTFYPCWNWKRKEIFDTVKESGLMLTSEYKYMKSSMEGFPCATTNKILRKHYPEDYERLLSYFPLMEAKTVREEFLDREAYQRKAAQIAANGGVAAPQDDVEILPSTEYRGEEEDLGEDDDDSFGGTMDGFIPKETTLMED